jgi:hypothetical protein
MHVRRLSIGVVLGVLTLATTAGAQPVSRLKGRIASEEGDPISDADIRIEAVWGFNANQYVGQRTFTARTNAKGEWSAQGLKAGIWVFDASAPGKLPAAVAVPINLVTAVSSGVSGLMLPWQLILKPLPPPHGDGGRVLVDAAAAAHSGDSGRVQLLLSSFPENSDARYFSSAGMIALAARQAGLARALFLKAVDRDRSSFQAALGSASSALMLRGFDAASRAFAAARDRTKDKDEQKYLTAAIGELAKIVVPTR